MLIANNPNSTQPFRLDRSQEVICDNDNAYQAEQRLWNGLKAGVLPSVTFIKAPANMTGHPNTSTALLERRFLVSTINQLEQSPMWKDMAIIITYDDSDGWYDHVMPPILSQSNDPSFDALTGPRSCGTAPAGAYQDRCGYGTRLPFLVISPYAKQNNVDSHTTDTISVLRSSKITGTWGGSAISLSMH